MSKNNKIPLIANPILRVQVQVANDIEWARANGSPNALLHLLSIAEYLKDARRWHYAQGNTLPEGLSGEELKKYVDGEIGQ